MRFHLNWNIISTAIALVLVSGTAALGQVQTPLQSSVVVQGTSGGSQSSACGFIAGSPSQTVRVTEAFTSLRFRVQGSEGSTLLISGPGGRTQCVMADRLSGGVIDVPGVWERGLYSLYVGDRTRGHSSAYTLSITPE